MSDFSGLGLAPALLQALEAAGYTTPTPIQVQAIPPALSGRDVQGVAQTGTGKTAAFALPLLHRLLQAHPDGRHGRPAARSCRVLVLAPTRELAAQIAENVRAYAVNTPLSCALVFGGVPKPRQIRELARGVDVLVATPGRLLDLMSEGAVSLAAVQAWVLDEADHMLDLGFIEPIRRIGRHLPEQHQSLLFTATLPPEMAKLAAGLLHDPVKVAVAPQATPAERIAQSVLFVAPQEKRNVLRALLEHTRHGRTLVFTRTKHGADKVVKSLAAAGIEAAAIHGNKSQPQRERALAGFRDGSCPVLIATDIAARGIDVEGVTHVINFDLPNVAESYVHRIGRTARAGASGMAISLCGPEERPFLRDIEKLLHRKVPVASLPGQKQAA